MKRIGMLKNGDLRRFLIFKCISANVFILFLKDQFLEPTSRNQCISSQDWIHLAIVHHFNYPVGNKGRFVVYVNGIKAEQKEVIRLSGSVKITRGHIGSGETIFSEGRNYIIEPFKGLMGTIYFFDDTKTPDQIARLYQSSSRFVCALLLFFFLKKKQNIQCATPITRFSKYLKTGAIAIATER